MKVVLSLPFKREDLGGISSRQRRLRVDYSSKTRKTVSTMYECTTAHMDNSGGSSSSSGSKGRGSQKDESSQVNEWFILASSSFSSALTTHSASKTLARSSMRTMNVQTSRQETEKPLIILILLMESVGW